MQAQPSQRLKHRYIAADADADADVNADANADVNADEKTDIAGRPHESMPSFALLLLPSLRLPNLLFGSPCLTFEFNYRLAKWEQLQN